MSSRNMYSEQGLLALIRAVFGQVCQSLMVVSNCMPGSPHCQAASAMRDMRSRARLVSAVAPSRTKWVDHSLSSTTARMNSSLARTE